MISKTSLEQIRQNNQQGAHLATNQINMHPQHQPQPQPNLQQGAPVLNSRMFPNNSNSQQIMSPPTMPVGHQNAPQPPSIIPNVANANRNNPAQYQNMNMNRMSFGNRFNLPRNYQQVPNMPPTQFVYQVPPYPNSAYPTPVSDFSIFDFNSNQSVCSIILVFSWLTVQFVSLLLPALSCSRLC